MNEEVSTSFSNELTEFKSIQFNHSVKFNVRSLYSLGSVLYRGRRTEDPPRARPRAKSGRKFAIGQVFLAFIFAPTGNGLSFFRTATRSGFERCNKNPNPIINPIFYPIFYPIATRLPQIFICFQLKFHIPDPFQLILALDNTKRVLFCANPEVDFEFLEYLTFWDTFDGSTIAVI